MSETNPPAIRERLHQLRRDADVSVETIAESMELSATALRARERGERGEWDPESVRRFVYAIVGRSALRHAAVVKDGVDILVGLKDPPATPH